MIFKKLFSYLSDLYWYLIYCFERFHKCGNCKYKSMFMGSAVICCHPDKKECCCERMKDYSQKACKLFERLSFKEFRKSW